METLCPPSFSSLDFQHWGNYKYYPRPVRLAANPKANFMWSDLNMWFAFILPAISKRSRDLILAHYCILTFCWRWNFFACQYLYHNHSAAEESSPQNDYMSNEINVKISQYIYYWCKLYRTHKWDRVWRTSMLSSGD